MSYCKYCTTYQESTIRTNGERFCKVVSKYVSGKGYTCSEYALAKLFWCDKNSQWLDVPVCKNRRFNQNEDCKKCKQWLDFTNLRSRNPEKRRSRE